MVGDTVDTAQSPAIFSDEEISMVLAVNSSQGIIKGLSGYSLAVPVEQVYSYGRTAATLLNGRGAVNARALVKKVLDVEIDTKSGTQMLKDIGQTYIDQEISAGYFSVAENGITAFWVRERWNAQMLRQNC